MVESQPSKASRRDRVHVEHIAHSPNGRYSKHHRLTCIELINIKGCVGKVAVVVENKVLGPCEISILSWKVH